MNTILGSILIIDDEEKIRQLLARILNLEGYKVAEACNARQGLKFLDEDTADVIICDVKLPDANGVELLKTLKQKAPYTEVILLTAHGDVKDAVRAVRNGAFDYLTKGDDNDRIIPLLARAIDKIKLENKIRSLETQLQPLQDFSQIVGVSQALSEAIELAKKVAPTDVTVLLLGETGTGKEVFADAIRRASNRKSKPFIAVNCSSFSKDLLESELFGYKTGAFTGAVKDKKGLIEEAQQGTLFLDEIGEIPSDIQAKLLRVLESGEYMKRGDTKTYKADVRIIAATHRDLPQEVREGKFREDLYYRLSTFTITLPPLRERGKDIELIAEHFIRKFSLKLNKKITGMTEDAREIINAYRWKGNIRELRNTIERAVILAEGDKITANELPFDIRHAESVTDNDTSPFDLTRIEKRYIVKALQHARGNKTRAAKLLNMGLTTLYQKLKDYQIKT